MSSFLKIVYNLNYKVGNPLTLLSYSSTALGILAMEFIEWAWYMHFLSILAHSCSNELRAQWLRIAISRSVVIMLSEKHRFSIFRFHCAILIEWVYRIIQYYYLLTSNSEKCKFWRQFTIYSVFNACPWVTSIKAICDVHMPVRRSPALPHEIHVTSTSLINDWCATLSGLNQRSKLPPEHCVLL